MDVLDVEPPSRHLTDMNSPSFLVPGSHSRRAFLRQAGTVAGFTVVAPAWVRGSEANSRITVGVIGLGGRGGWIADHLATQPGYQITAVADYFPTVAMAVGERLKVPKERRYSGLDGFQKVIASRVEAIFLETPPYFLPKHARAAVTAGCHVYMAKPVAVDVPGTLEVLELGRRSTQAKKSFLVDFQTRTDPFHIEAVRRVRAGEIGKLGLIASYYHDECFDDPVRGKTVENLLTRLAWVNDTALGGSYMVNCDIHAVDVALWLAGALPEGAMGFASRCRPNAQGDSHDCYAVSFQFPNGLVMTDHSEHVRNGTEFRSGCQAYGERGWIEANYAGKVFIRGTEDGYAGGENKALYADGMKANVEAFRRSIVEGRSGNPTLEPSVNATLATLLARAAVSTGRKVTWSELLADQRRLEVDLTGLTV